MNKSSDILKFNSNWKSTTIDKVSDYVQRGKGPKYSDEINDYPVINQQCIHWEKINYKYIKYVKKDYWESLESHRFLKPGDILWNSTGTGTIGRASIFFPSEHQKVIVDGHITIIRLEKNYNPLFLFYFIASPYIQTEMEMIFSGSTDQVELNLPKIKKTIIPDISIKDQNTIVSKIKFFYENYYKLNNSLINISEQKIKGKLQKLEKKFLLDSFK